MRATSLLSLLFLLGTTTASAVPAAGLRQPRAGVAVSDWHLASRAMSDPTAAGAWPHLVARNDGDSAVTPSDTKISVVSVATEAGGADVVLLAAAPTADGDFTILGDGLGSERNGQIAGALPSLGLASTAGALVRVQGTADDPAKVIAVVSTGKVEDEPTPEKLRQVAGAALRSLAGVNKVTVAMPTGTSDQLAAVIEGAALGAYAFQEYKSASPVVPVAEVTIVTNQEDATAAAAKADVITRHVKSSRRLTSTPANVLYPQSFVDHVNDAASGFSNVEVEVWDENRLREEGMNLLLNVGMAAIPHPPRLVKVAYTPANAKGHIALVGKGITLDTGGYNLKTGAGMATMKSDMTGAGVVLHTALAAAELELPVRVTAWLCLAENMVDALGQRPGDVWTAYNGKTVEITNTDAEGRLVMGDGLAKAAEKSPTSSLGNRIAGLMGDKPAVEALEKAAASTGEGFWYMPFPEEMYADMVSPVADYRNAGTGSDGGMLKGGIFLQPFAAGATWAHLDIAGPAFNNGQPYGYTPIQGTGFGLRTLLKVVEQYGQ